MDKRFELQERLNRAEQAQINALEGDTANATNWRILRKELGVVFPAGLEAARALSQRFLLDGYILGLREALGIELSQRGAGEDLTLTSRLKDKLIEVHNPRSGLEAGLLMDSYYTPGSRHYVAPWNRPRS